MDIPLALEALQYLNNQTRRSRLSLAQRDHVRIATKVIKDILDSIQAAQEMNKQLEQQS